MRQGAKKQIFQVLIAVFITAMVVRIFILDSFIVKGDSMAPSILPGDYVFMNRLSYGWGKPVSRGDVVVARFRKLERNVIKRVLGLPGERVEIIPNQISIKKERTEVGNVVMEKEYLNLPNFATNGTTTIKLDPQEYFLLGDNRFISTDSRELGAVDLWDIEGRIFLLVRVKNLSIYVFKGNTAMKVY